MNELKKITESTLMPISLVVAVCSFAYAWAKLESRLEIVEKKSSVLYSIDRRLYRIEIKNGIHTEPIKQGE
jgi:hypothetical protein